MTFQMAWKDSVGNHYAEAAWWPIQINILTTGNAHITWYAAQDISTLYAHYQTNDVPWIPGAIKDYTLSGPEYWNYYGQHMADNGPNLNALVHAHALGKLDTPTGETDQDGTPLYKSFFSGAVQS